MNTKSFSKRSLAVVLTTILLLVAIPATAVFAASSGPRYPGTASGSGWGSPTNIGVDDTNYATYSIPGNGTSTALNGSNYSFAIPADATINGITVEIGRGTPFYFSTDLINDSVVQLLKAGVATGDNKATTTDWPNNSQGTATYGGPTDLWGTTWTPADINNTNFGATLSAFNQSGSSRTANVDFIRITVTYNEVFSGATNAGSGADVGGVGTLTWVNPGNVVSDNNSYATAGTNGQTHYLQATNYGFAIPSGSTILGIQATIGRSGTTGSGSDVRDAVVSLIKGGTVSGDNKAVTGNDWGSTETAVTYGSSSDLWGLSWTADDINASNFGLALSINANGETASVDYMQINVTYTLPVVPTTTTTVNCVANPITYGGNTTCTATVARGSGINTPSGLVSWTTDASGGFVTSPCSLSDIGGGSASCSVTYTPSSVGDGTHLITATYAGDSNFQGSNGNQTVTVNKATPTATLAVSNSPITYDTVSHSATVDITVSSVSGSVSNILTGGLASQTNANTYAVTADFVPTDSANYNTLTGLSAGNFIINKAAADCSSIAGYSVTYDTASHTATGTCQGVGSDGTLVGLDLSATTHTVAGTYNGDGWTFTDVNGNYNNTSGTVNNSIAKATPTATLGVNNSPVPYDGLSHSATVGITGSSVGGSVSNISTGGAASQTNANTYAVTADFVPTDSANYNSLLGLSAGNFTINKADATIVVNGFTGTYSGGAHGATGTAKGVLNESLSGLSLGASFTNVPGGTANWTFTDVTGNYNDDSGSVSIVINKANATLVVNGFTGTYTGGAHGATGTATGVLSESLSGLNLGASFTNVPGGTANWTFTDVTGNYNDDSGNASIVINKANATIVVNGYTGAYDGAAHGATGTATGVLSESLSGLSLGASFTDVPGGTANWTFTDVTGNYNNDSGNASIVISKANPTLAVTNSPVTYTGAGQAATVDAGLVAGSASNILTGGVATQTNAGTYAVTADFTPTDTTNYNSLVAAPAGNFIINKATAIISVSGYTGVYDGAAHGATGAATGVLSESLSGLNLGASFTNVPGGTANWTFTDVTGNYNNDSGSEPIVISKADPTLTVTNSPVTFNGNPQSATVSAGSVAGTVGNIQYNSSPTAPTAVGSYAVTADFTSSDSNYNDLTGAPAGNFVITAKLVPTVTATGGPFTYDGASHSATVNGSVDGVVSNVKYNGSSTAPTNAGTYTVTADFTPTDTVTYESLVNAVAGSITINKAALTVTANNQSKIAGSADPDFTFGYSGFVNSETSAVIDTAPACGVSVAHNVPGTYPIVCSGGVDNNYIFSYVNATLTVNSANNPPTNISLSKSNIDENQPANTLVGSLSTTDPDAGDVFTYSFCGGADDASFVISGSNLQSAVIFDFETKSSYSVCIRSTDAGTLSTTKTFAITINNLVDTQTFQDVPPAYWAYSYIERLYAAGVTGGCATSPNLIYCPDSTVTRAQMAVFLLKGVHGSSYAPPAATGTVFTDVPSSYWAAAWIEQLAAEGITGGCGTGVYCPDATVTRAQMAVFLLKAKHGSSYAPPAATGVFTDVPVGYWADKWIEQLASEGITGGCGTGTYCPDSDVTRAQMAVFLVKTFNLP